MPGASSPITVREIWDLALGADACLQGGERGLARPVQWATALHATYPLFPDLDRGHLALGSPEVARRLDAQLTLSYLIRELAHAQAAGLVVDEAPDTAARELADELEIPLFSVPDGTDLRALEREVLRALLDREGHEARRAAEWRREYEELLAPQGTGAVIERLASDFGVGVALADAAGVVLSQAGRDRDGSVALCIEDQVYSISVTGRHLGSLRITVPEKVSSLLPVAARQAADVCGLDMIQVCVRRETEDQLGADLVADLLDPAADRESVLGRLSRQGYDLTPGRRHVAVALATGSKESVGVSTAAASLESDLRFAGRRDGACALMLAYQDVFLCLLSVPSSVSDQRLRAWLVQACGPHAQHGCRVAVSRTVSDARGLASTVQQALAAEAMGRRMSTWQGPLFYADMGLYRLLLGLRDQTEVQRFYNDTLGRLVDYDREHNTDLVATLHAFFEQNANASETARKLFVHRNTLNYRLRRIAEIVGLDLDSADTRLALQVALRIQNLGS
ncbi:MAG: helix-turn-helix domain-containing protein [Anaerolineae bacterium]